MFVAQGATFTFNGIGATVTRIAVETPVAEIVDMTAGNDQPKTVGLVPTGEWRGGSVSVDFIYAAGGIDPQSVVGTVGQLQFNSRSLSIGRRVILESADYQASVGELVRGTLNFRMTDWAGS
jgi:hypothetical protein